MYRAIRRLHRRGALAALVPYWEHDHPGTIVALALLAEQRERDAESLADFYACHPAD